MQQLLERIRAALEARRCPGEAAVSTSIVLPVLRELGWDDADPNIVRPEHRTDRGRVDYALFIGNNRPAIFVEVKGVGNSANADRQLFEMPFMRAHRSQF